MNSKQINTEHPHLLVRPDYEAKEVSINITGAIGFDFDAAYMMDAMTYYDLSDMKRMTLNIFSGGGSLIDAFTVYDFLRGRCKAMYPDMKIVAGAYGLCASAATVMMCAADECYMGENTLYGIHYAYYPSGREADKQLEIANKMLVNIYKRKTGMTAPQIKKMLNDAQKEDSGMLFMDATEAKKMNFVNGVISNKEHAQNKAKIKAIAAFYNPVTCKIEKPEQDESHKQNDKMTLIEKLKALFEKKGISDADSLAKGIVDVFEQHDATPKLDVDAIKAEILETISAKRENELDLTAELQDAKAQLLEQAENYTNSLKEIESKLTAQVKTNTELSKKVEAVNNAHEALKAEIEATASDAAADKLKALMQKLESDNADGFARGMLNKAKAENKAIKVNFKGKTYQ